MRRFLGLVALGCRVASHASAADEPDGAAAHAEIVAHLKNLVRIDTSNPPGNETKVATRPMKITLREKRVTKGARRRSEEAKLRGEFTL